MGARRQSLTLAGLFLLSLFAALAPPSAAHAVEAPESEHEHVVISEFLVSPSSEDYNGTDWNGDGYYGKEGDQFIELYNPTPNEANISGWWLDDDPDGGSPRCQIGWGTLLQPGERMAFYRAKTGIELDYFDGDVIRLEDSWGDLVDSASFPAEHSYYDISYGRDSAGSWVHIGSPTPGSPNDGTYVGPNHLQGSCYTVRDHIHDGQYILKGRVVTMNSEDAVLDRGNVFVKDGVIQAVWEDGQPPGADVWSVPEIDSGGTIYPGLIDMHNHIHYNMLPLWDYELQGGFYTNRYQWKNNAGYKPSVTWPKSLIQSGPYWDLEESSVKYAEMKEITGGTTAVQGGPSNDDEAFSWILARNIEYYNFGRDEMHTKVTELEDEYIGAHITNGNASGELDGWFLHLSEGTDASSLDEFRILQEGGLLVGETIIIHGVPLRETEFAAMAAVGSSLVWSPTSNMLLYGDTARVDLARAAGVNIALAPDWSPSGTKSPLHELKTADWWNKNKLNGVFSDYELVQMVTSNAADAMNWEAHAGRIGVGKAADLVVIDSFADDPYRNLIQAIDPDVRLTIVGGLPLYGDVDLMTLLKGDDMEIVQGEGFQKALDITFSGVPLGQDSWATIESSLTTALHFSPDEMYEVWSEASNHESVDSFAAWFAQQYPGLESIELDPIFTYGDQRYFSVLNSSASFNSQGDIAIYDDYYNLTFDADGNRSTGWVAPPAEENPYVPPEESEQPDDTDNTSNTTDDGPPTTEEEESTSGGLLDASSPIYWMAMLFTLMILGGSVFVMFRFTRNGGQPPPGDTGIGTPDLGIEPPFG